MSESVTFTIPMQPPRELNPNYHGSWQRKAREVAVYREQCGWAVKVALAPWRLAEWGGEAPVVMDFAIAWTWHGRTLDDDNAKACCKSIIDGVSDVLWGGQDRHVRIGSVSQSTGGAGEVVVTIRRVAENTGNE